MNDDELQRILDYNYATEGMQSLSPDTSAKPATAAWSEGYRDYYPQHDYYQGQPFQIDHSVPSHEVRGFSQNSIFPAGGQHQEAQAFAENSHSTSWTPGRGQHSNLLQVPLIVGGMEYPPPAGSNFQISIEEPDVNAWTGAAHSAVANTVANNTIDFSLLHPNYASLDEAAQREDIPPGLGSVTDPSEDSSEARSSTSSRGRHNKSHSAARRRARPKGGTSSSRIRKPVSRLRANPNYEEMRLYREGRFSDLYGESECSSLNAIHVGEWTSAVLVSQEDVGRHFGGDLENRVDKELVTLTRHPISPGDGTRWYYKLETKDPSAKLIGRLSEDATKFEWVTSTKVSSFANGGWTPVKMCRRAPLEQEQTNVTGPDPPEMATGESNDLSKINQKGSVPSIVVVNHHACGWLAVDKGKPNHYRGQCSKHWEKERKQKQNTNARRPKPQTRSDPESES
ncbi:hypothetical protein I302_109083 [Kwoniella bestiolae CBS 10118]|uniref:Uncharacterized protein n=1 Tax=Kwoniella bestiolae CBS 10118 TaxID=1296100 RepID=A0A1B9FUX6_9TREE|nr:hypothetical protein I302_08227 [Kwoniella bestiolae CBS 10118]OCF22577.1 hypothetical protein I302_08227 [Kwoniella bestiolae CBS 10118]